MVTTAQADHTSIHATAAGDVAATDNVFSAPSGGAREADVYTQVRPGVLFAYDTPRMIDELTAELEVLEYVVHSKTPSLTVRGGWKGLFLTGPRSEVLVVANASTGRLNAISARTAPDQAVVGVLPTGELQTRQADGTATWSYQALKQLRTSAAGFTRWAATTDGLAMPTTTESLESGATLAFDRPFDRDSVGLELGGSYLSLQRIAPPTPTTGSQLVRSFEPRATAVWRHDFDAQWTVNADAGVVYIEPVGTDPYNPSTKRSGAAVPVIGALAAYSQPWGRAALTVRRAVTPNLFLAQNTVSDSAVAQLAIPLPWLDENPHARAPKLAALGSAGLERSQLIDPASSMLVGSFKLARLDVGVIWTPRPGQTYGLRYEVAYQHGDAVAALVTPSFYRNTVFFTFALRWPERVAVEIPQRSSVRADRGDVSPIGGGEPVVPEPAESSPGGQ